MLKFAPVVEFTQALEITTFLNNYVPGRDTAESDEETAT